MALSVSEQQTWWAKAKSLGFVDEADFQAFREAYRKEVGVNVHAPEEDRVNEHIMARTTMYIRLGWLTDTQAKALAECLLDWYPAQVTEVWNARP